MLRCACEIQFGKMCYVCAFGAFLGVRSAIAISQFSIWSLNKSGPESGFVNLCIRLQNNQL